MEYFLTALVGVLFLAQNGFAVTLEEAEQDPAKYIRYTQGPFNLWLHAGVSILLLYGILSFIVISISAIAKFIGGTTRAARKGQ
ncbi:hypothetical protein Ciccas_010228 [Cichlidogyrus casuarinus]|uniref:Uncharacterized protein n=1 Tax=Cichlidogyrus casuarinus TaxID=1844966 RepID=A0ABD2PVV0_9PLAT